LAFSKYFYKSVSSGNKKSKTGRRNSVHIAQFGLKNENKTKDDNGKIKLNRGVSEKRTRANE
jgi:hypothetical protein